MDNGAEFNEQRNLR